MKKFLPLLISIILTIPTLLCAQTVETYLRSAIDKQGSGDNKGAVEDCNKALSIDPANAYVFNVRGLANYNLGLYDDAIADYNRTIAANKTNNAIAYNYRGACQYAKNNLLNAKNDFTAAIHLAPKYVSAYNNRGNANVRMEQYQQAVADFTTAIALDPTDAVAYNNRAFAEDQLRHFTEAIADCEMALKLGAKVAAGAFRNRGFARIGLGMYDLGIEDCNRSLSLDFQYARTYQYRGYAYFKQGKYDLALKDEESVNEYEKQNDDMAKPFEDYHDEAVRLSKTMRPTNTTAIANNMPTVTNTPTVTPAAPVNAPAKDIPIAVQKTIAQAESSPTKALVLLNWSKPTDDFRSLPDGILTLHDNNLVNIRIKASSTAPFDTTKFHLYVNGRDYQNGNKMTVVSMKDIGKPSSKKYEYVYEAKVNVAQGKSTIIFNYGDTPIDDTLKVLYAPTDINLHVLAIGTHGQGLKYAEKDAKDFADLFSKQKGEHRLFHDAHAEVLQGDETNAHAMSKKISEWSSKTYGERDVLILFISSHGLVDKGSLLLTGSDFDATQTAFTTINFKDNILTPLEGANCKKFIFIDACHSGEGLSGGKAVEQDVATEINKMVNSGNSVTIISSSSSSEQSWEDESWGNGVFTRAIRDGLQDDMPADTDHDGFVKINELYEYIKTRIAKLIELAGKKDLNGNLVVQTPRILNARGDVSIFQQPPKN